MVIYKVTDRTNGKAYIGQTAKKLERRWYEHVNKANQGSNLVFHSAIREHGAENFQVEAIDYAATREEALSKENYWILKLDCIYPKGYNSNEGGAHPKTEEFVKLKNSGKNHWSYGKKLPKETLQKKHDALYRKPSGRSRPVRCVETGEVQPFAKEFFYKYGYQHSKILECCKGRRQTHRGFHWEYAEEVI